MLRLKIGQATRAHGPATGNDSEKLSWHLVKEIGRTVRATLDRVESPGVSLLMIKFPRTVRDMEGLTAMEVNWTFRRPSVRALQR